MLLCFLFCFRASQLVWIHLSILYVVIYSAEFFDVDSYCFYASLCSVASLLLYMVFRGCLLLV